MLCALLADVSVPPVNVSVSVAQFPVLPPAAMLYCCVAVSPVAAVTVSVPLAAAATERSDHDASYVHLLFAPAGISLGLQLATALAPPGAVLNVTVGFGVAAAAPVFEMLNSPLTVTFCSVVERVTVIT
jgi:hypothetical protein